MATALVCMQEEAPTKGYEYSTCSFERKCFFEYLFPVPCAVSCDPSAKLVGTPGTPGSANSPTFTNFAGSCGGGFWCDKSKDRVCGVESLFWVVCG